MKPFLVAVVAALASIPAVACCGPAEPSKPASPLAPSAAAPDRGKLEAPVEIESVLDGNVAHLTLRFASAATGVRVGVSGVDGLAVAGSPTLVDGASFDRGAVATFDVPFTPGPGRSMLSVAVSGSFGGGGHLAKIRTLSVGTPTPEQQKANAETAKTPAPEGVKIVVPK